MAQGTGQSKKNMVYRSTRADGLADRRSELPALVTSPRVRIPFRIGSCHAENPQHSSSNSNLTRFVLFFFVFFALSLSQRPPGRRCSAVRLLRSLCSNN